MRRQVETNVLLSWEAWERLVLSKMVDMEYLLDQVRNDFSLCGLSFKSSDEWLDVKLKEMQDKIRQEKFEKNKFKRKGTA